MDTLTPSSDVSPYKINLKDSRKEARRLIKFDINQNYMSIRPF